MSIDAVPYEIVSMIYQLCDSAGKLRFFVAYSRIMRTGLRPPILQNVLISIIRNGGNLSEWSRKIDDPLGLFRAALDSNNLSVLPMLKPYLEKYKLNIRGFRHIETRKLNQDFFIWAAKNNMHVTGIKGSNVLLMYYKYSSEPNVCVLEQPYILDTEILDTVWCTAKFHHRVWKIPRRFTLVEVTSDVYNWFESHEFPHMEKLRVVDDLYESISQQICDAANLPESGGYEPDEVNYILYRYDHERKFMRLTNLGLLQKVWKYIQDIPYREDLYAWAINSGAMNWNNIDCRAQIIGYGTDEMFHMLLHNRKIKVSEMLKYAKLPRLLSWLEVSGITLCKAHTDDLNATDNIMDPEVLIWLYKTGVFSTFDVVQFAFEHKNLLSDMIRLELFSSADIPEIIELLANPNEVFDEKNTYTLYTQTLKKILKRGYFVESIKHNVLLMQLAERNRRWPSFHVHDMNCKK